MTMHFVPENYIYIILYCIYTQNFIFLYIYIHMYT